MKNWLLFLLLAFSLSLKGQWRQANFPVTGAINAFCQHDKGLFAATNHGIYVSTNNGINWVAVNTGLKDLTILSIATNGQALFAGTLKGGIYTSTNNGLEWLDFNAGFSTIYPVNSGLSNLNVTALAFSGSCLFAGSDLIYALNLITGINALKENNSFLAYIPIIAEFIS